MWNVTDDITGEQFAKENRISVEISFTNPADKKFYKTKLDISPKTYTEKIATMTKLQWSAYFKHTTDEEKKKYDGKAGHYEPAKNVGQIIASLIEEAPTQ